MTIDSKSEIALDASISADSNSQEKSSAKTHEKQLVSEIADASEDNKDDL
jgi:hypothetical protein